jgi:hypothetical protein
VGEGDILNEHQTCRSLVTKALSESTVAHMQIQGLLAISDPSRTILFACHK